MIKTLFIASFFIIGLYKITRDGYIWDFMQTWNIRPWIKKPLFNCPVCMSSVWGTVFFIPLNHSPVFFEILFNYITFIVSLAGLTYVLMKIAYHEL